VQVWGVFLKTVCDEFFFITGRWLEGSGAESSDLRFENLITDFCTAAKL